MHVPQKYRPLLIALVALIALPFVLLAVGLTLTTATDVVIFAIACMGLNILVGHTGLVSFGHGAFFGLAAYAAALSQRHWFPGDIVISDAVRDLPRRGVRVACGLSHPAPARRLFLAADARALRHAVRHRVPLDRGDRRRKRARRRRASVSPRHRSRAPVDLLLARRGDRLCSPSICSGASIARAVGHVLVAIRENEQRARFIGYPTDRYKLFAFTASAAITALAGALVGVQPPLCLGRADLGAVLRRAAGHGRHRRHALVPRAGARRAVLHPVPRIPLDLDRRTGCSTSACLFVGFIVFSPTGLVGVAERVLAPFRKRQVEAAAMAGREISQGCAAPAALARASVRRSGADRTRACQKLRRHPRGRATPRSSCSDRTLHALIGPNGAGKTTAFNLVSGMFPPDTGFITVAGQGGRRAEARGHHARRRRPLVPDHQPVRRPVGRGEHAPRRAGAQPASASPGGRRPKASPRSTPRRRRS